MNLRDLEYLLAVAETRHFGHAADRCHVSQPTLSGQIKKLEQTLGVRLFERSNKKVTVTPIGERILEHARKALVQADLIRQIAATHQDPLAGPFRLGVIPTLGPYIVPLILKPLREQVPQMQLVLIEEMTGPLTERLDSHQLDAVLLATPPENEQFRCIELFDEPFWLALHRDDPLYQAESIDAKQLAKLRLLLLSDGHCLANQVLSVCGQQEIEPGHTDNDLRAASLDTLLQLVAAGYGSTLVPAMAMRGGWLTDMGIIARPLDVPNAFRRVRLVYRDSFPRPTAVAMLADIIRQGLPNTVRPLPTETT